jgi:hypothetical protein
LHDECAVASADLGDPELEAMARLNLAMVLSQLDEWRAATPELLRGLWLGQEVGDLELRLTAVSIGASVLHAAGDPSGAALLWAMSKTISEDREMQINPLDRDDAAFAKVRDELGSDYADIERRALGVTLEEATAAVASRLRLLIDSSPAS